MLNGTQTIIAVLVLILIGSIVKNSDAVSYLVYDATILTRNIIAAFNGGNVVEPKR